MSEYASDGKFPWQKNRGGASRIWLDSEFRVSIIKKGIEKAGSVNKLGRILGYRSKIHPGWSIRRILLGKQSFPRKRLKKLAEYLDYSMDEILEYQTSSRRVTSENTRKALREFGLHYYLPK